MMLDIFDDLAFANRISFFLLLFIFILFLTENLSKKSKYHLDPKGAFKQKEKIKLKGINSFFAFLFCFLIFLLSFLFPLGQMLYWTIKFPENLFDINILNLFMNTAYLVTLSSLVLLSFALISNYGNRVSRNKVLNFLSNINFWICNTRSNISCCFYYFY